MELQVPGQAKENSGWGSRLRRPSEWMMVSRLPRPQSNDDREVAVRAARNQRRFSELGCGRVSAASATHLAATEPRMDSRS